MFVQFVIECRAIMFCVKSANGVCIVITSVCTNHTSNRLVRVPVCVPVFGHTESKLALHTRPTDDQLSDFRAHVQRLFRVPLRFRARPAVAEIRVSGFVVEIGARQPGEGYWLVVEIEHRDFFSSGERGRELLCTLTREEDACNPPTSPRAASSQRTSPPSSMWRLRLCAASVEYLCPMQSMLKRILSASVVRRRSGSLLDTMHKHILRKRLADVVDVCTHANGDGAGGSDVRVRTAPRIRRCLDSDCVDGDSDSDDE